MFEPSKLITVGLTLLLLAPFSFVFWRLAIHQPRTEADRKAQAEALLQDRAKDLGVVRPDGSILAGVGVVNISESIAFSRSTASWLSFYPRRWVGVLGLVATAIILLCMMVSLFLPDNSKLSASRWADKPSVSSDPKP